MNTVTQLIERANPGLHDRVEQLVAPLPPGKGLDLGCGSGAFAERLKRRGWEVTAADKDKKAYKASVPFVSVDLEVPGWHRKLPGPFDLIVAIEVLEHLGSPLLFFRGVAQLLSPQGVAIVTTPNVESWIGRLRFLAKGKLRMMDEKGEPTHVMPTFTHLLTQRWLPQAGLKLREHHTFPSRGTENVRPLLKPIVKGLSYFFPVTPPWQGDYQIFVLART